ncbi:cytochrome P450 [Streptomyces sp. NPDC004647]|uniref:cytochrome P450 n=1 Tax=Streptomyces sp. NPDC004647 TaxID=3154671 RepID=UPI0033AA1C53
MPNQTTDPPPPVMRPNHDGDRDGDGDRGTEPGTRTEPGTGTEIDFGSAAFQTDPWPLYDWYREHRPVHLSPVHDSYFVFGYDHVRQVMTSSDFTAFHPFRTSRRAFGPSMLDSDGAEHTRLRSAAAGSFRPRPTADFAQRIVSPFAGEMLDELLTDGRADFIEVLARRLPMRVVCRMMGLPDSDADWLHETMRPLVAYVDHDDVPLDEVVAHRGTLRDYFRGFTTGCPAESGLLGTLAETGTLSDADLVNTSILLLAAGTETTTGGLTNLLCRIAAEPEVFERIRKERSLIPAVVAETLRHEPPLHVTLRFAAQEVTLGGVRIPEGAPLQVVLASANRDPAVYERPHAWDPARERRATLSFGMGRHACLGMGLANRELEIVLNAVLDRVERMSLDNGVLPTAQGRTFRMVSRSRCTVTLRDAEDRAGAQS